MHTDPLIIIITQSLFLGALGFTTFFGLRFLAADVGAVLVVSVVGDEEVIALEFLVLEGFAAPPWRRRRFLRRPGLRQAGAIADAVVIALGFLVLVLASPLRRGRRDGLRPGPSPHTMFEPPYLTSVLSFTTGKHHVLTSIKP